jgi:hypothetical protein
VLAAPPPGPPRSALPTASAPATEVKQAILSCDEVIRSTLGEPGRGRTASILNRGVYLNPCGVPVTTRVEVCLATREGKILGMDVRTTPTSDALDSCITQGIRSLSFPSEPSLDVSRVVFEEQ